MGAWIVVAILCAGMCIVLAGAALAYLQKVSIYFVLRGLQSVSMYFAWGRPHAVNISFTPDPALIWPLRCQQETGACASRV